MAIRAVLFDVFGTLVDTGSVAQRAEELFPGNGSALSNLWREKQLVYTRLRGLGGRYINFTGLTEDALMSAADALHLPLDAASRGALMHEFTQLKTFSDVLPALTRIRASGVTMGVISNGDAALLAVVEQARRFDRGHVVEGVAERPERGVAGAGVVGLLVLELVGGRAVEADVGRQ